MIGPAADEAPERPALSRLVAGEALAYAIQGALYPVTAALASRDGHAGPAVVLVHGHGASPGSLWPLGHALARAGYRRVTSFGYRARGRVEDHAAALGELVDAKVPRDVPVLVVGHSLGGIIARLWLQDLGGAERTRAFVSLSTPHRGLALARLARPVPLIRELTPDSALMKRLWAGADRLGSVSCLSVVSGRDHFIRAPGDAAFHPATLVTVDHVGHAGVLFSPAVHALVTAHLVAAAPPPGMAATAPGQSAQGADR